MWQHGDNDPGDVTWFELILGLMMIPVLALVGLCLWAHHFIKGKLRKEDINVK